MFSAGEYPLRQKEFNEPVHLPSYRQDSNVPLSRCCCRLGTFASISEPTDRFGVRQYDSCRCGSVGRKRLLSQGKIDLHGIEQRWEADGSKRDALPEKVGFIGLGVMGKPMALNVTKAGAKVASTVEDLFAECRIVIIMLFNENALTKRWREIRLGSSSCLGTTLFLPIKKHQFAREVLIDGSKQNALPAKLENEMAYVIQITATGGAEVLTYKETDIGPPGENELRIKQTCCGVNFIDTYFRSGLYPVELPFTPGQEAVGVVTSIGPGIADFKVGDRVAYTGKGGGYASERNVPGAAAFKVPDWVSDEAAAALTMKGLTAQMLIRQTFRVEPGMTVLVHAAAGGMGTILAQWASHLGARVIGTVGSDEKIRMARKNGCKDVIVYSREDFAERVLDITAGKLCDVVYDGVGKTTAIGSLDSLKPMGMFVSYGNASGPVEPFAMLELAKRGSLFATRPMMPHYASTRERLVSMIGEFYEALRDGVVKAPNVESFTLENAADAHRSLEGRHTTGSVVLVP
jgi:NADPH2:quinone reductase